MVKGQKKPGISRQAMKIVQTMGNTSGEEDLKALEEEVMGESRDPDAQKSAVMERNLNQMVIALNQRLKGLEDAAKLRMQYCEEDLNANSTISSRQAPKVSDELDDIGIISNKKGDNNTSSSGNTSSNRHTSNLITNADQHVMIDANRLVLRTKPATETGKRLEAAVEANFGSTGSGSGLGAKKTVQKNSRSKKAEAKKNEEKRLLRIRLEKDLQANMDNYITRSVLDPDIHYRIGMDEEPGMEDWPISIRWPKKDARAAHPDNADNLMSPDILLQYATERMSLPSGEHLFRWLVKQTVVQQLYVYFWWYIKIKFFQKDLSVDEEFHLLQRVSTEYVKVVELLSQRAHEEHEKDFVYRFLPYILAHGIYFGFYHLCPGSRHLYTKAFRRTVLMQVVNSLHGIQLCPVSVKVSWAKLFPDEQENEADEDNELEQFPSSIAIPTQAQAKATAKYLHNTFRNTEIDSDHTIIDGGASWGFADSTRGRIDSPSNRTRSRSSSPVGMQQTGHMTGMTTSHRPFASGPNTLGRSGMIAMDDDGAPIVALKHQRNEGMSTMATTMNSSKSVSNIHNSPSKNVTMMSKSSSASIIEHDNSNNNSLNRPLSNGGTDVLRPSSTRGTGRGVTPSSALPMSEVIKRIETAPITRATLKPAPKKPDKHLLPRQPAMSMDAQSVSPLMQQFMQAPTGNVGKYKQHLGRTVPVSWCKTGGSDTFRRRLIPKELHDEISRNRKKLESQAHKISIRSHKDRVKAVHQLNDDESRILAMGRTHVSKFSHDLMKQQIARRRGVKDKEKTLIDLSEILGTHHTQMTFTYDDLMREEDISEYLNF